MERQVLRWIRTSAFLAALALACCVLGAIPGWTLPTLGQAVWASGFAASSAKTAEFTLYATHFGLPHPAGIAFGLPATFPQSLLIRLGFHPLDAYSIVVVLYAALALWGASALARRLGATPLASTALGLLWLCLPVVWWHTEYSMVALGFALLPFYLHAALRLFDVRSRLSAFLDAIAFIGTCVLAVFMDGYTFMMFAVANLMLLLSHAWRADRVTAVRIAAYVTPAMVTGMGLAYVLYRAYTGHHDYQPSSMDFFRGWGADVTMFLIPTQGIQWLWDALGWSVKRDTTVYWGDGSVWSTTFIAPILLTGVAGAIIARKGKHSLALILIVMAGIYLSLGPSLKFDSTKQAPGITSREAGFLMPEKYAIAPTGSAILSQRLPGFQLMRAAYRWIGLGALGLWGLTVLLVARVNTRSPLLAYGLIAALVPMMLPHMLERWHVTANRREAARAMESQLVTPLQQTIGGRSRVLFIPYGNDFIVNYLAPLAGFKSYNIGGDKNLEIARSSWTPRMASLSPGNLPPQQFVENAVTLLAIGEADALVIPYFDLLWAAHAWPPPASSVAALRTQRLPRAREIAASACVDMKQTEYFVVLTLNPSGESAAAAPGGFSEHCQVRR